MKMSSESVNRDDLIATRERKLRDLEEQLAREREQLDGLREANPTGISPDEVGSPDNSLPNEQTDQDELELTSSQDDFYRYSENLTIPDDDIDDTTNSIVNPSGPPQHRDDIHIESLLREIPVHEDKSSLDSEIRETSSQDSSSEPLPDPLPQPLPGSLLEPIPETFSESLPESPPDSPPSVEDEIAEYRNDIDEFRSRGYNISRMYDIFSADLDTIRREVLKYMQDVTHLKEIEKQLEELDTNGFERDMHTLQTMLKNPDMLDDARSFFTDLQYRTESKDSVERESKIRELESIFDNVLHEFQDVAERFEDPITDIKVSIIDMETAPISEYYAIKKMVFELKESMIKDKFEREKEGKKASLFSEMAEWEKKGFVLDEIKSQINGEFKAATDLFNDFLNKAEQLLELERELNLLPTAGFEGEAGEIRKILRDTEKVFLVKNSMKSLKRRIRLAGIKTKMERMKTSTDGSVLVEGAGEMPCPKCDGIVAIPSVERPLKVQCSSCKTEFHLKRIPTSETPLLDQPSDGEGILVKPIQEPSAGPPAPANAGPVVAPSPRTSEKCPKCGSELLQGSVFCGLCGYRLSK